MAAHTWSPSRWPRLATEKDRGDHVCASKLCCSSSAAMGNAGLARLLCFIFRVPSGASHCSLASLPLNSCTAACSCFGACVCADRRDTLSSGVLHKTKVGHNCSRCIFGRCGRTTQWSSLQLQEQRQVDLLCSACWRTLLLRSDTCALVANGIRATPRVMMCPVVSRAHEAACVGEVSAVAAPYTCKRWPRGGRRRWALHC